MDEHGGDELEGSDASDALDGDTVDPETVERPVDRFRRTATGAVIAAGLLGLRDALEGQPEKDEVAIVKDAPEPRPTGDLEVVVDFDHPERSVAIVRRPPRP
jgi:hypothetical protein